MIINILKHTLLTNISKIYFPMGIKTIRTSKYSSFKMYWLLLGMFVALQVVLPPNFVIWQFLHLMQNVIDNSLMFGFLIWLSLWFRFFQIPSWFLCVFKWCFIPSDSCLAALDQAAQLTLRPTDLHTICNQESHGFGQGRARSLHMASTVSHREILRPNEWPFCVALEAHRIPGCWTVLQLW